MGLAELDKILEFLWEKLPKAPDESHATFTEADIDMLWHIGFIDTEQYTIEAWRAPFANFKNAAGEAVLQKEDFLALDHYRFQGEVYVPFNPLEINEGRYTAEGLQELVDASIAPSTDYTPEELATLTRNLKKTYDDGSGLIEIRLPAKQEICQWLQDRPSPRRRLELIYAHMYLSHALEYIETGEFTTAKTPKQVARVEASTFSMLSTSPAQQRATALKSLEQTTLPEMPKEDEAKKGTPLKAIKRSPRGLKS